MSAAFPDDAFVPPPPTCARTVDQMQALMWIDLIKAYAAWKKAEEAHSKAAGTLRLEYFRMRGAYERFFHAGEVGDMRGITEQLDRAAQLL